MTLNIDEEKFGADWMNNGALGGSSIFRHTYRFLREYGYEPQEVNIQLAFGKGTEGFWTNMFPTPLLEKHRHEIERFGKALRIVRRFKYPLWVIPLKKFFRIFRFSKEFEHQIVYPVTSILMSIGNEAEDVPCGILQRLLDDPEMRLWEFDPVSFMPARPRLLAFPNMAHFFTDWAAGLRAKGVIIRLNTQALKVLQRDGRGIIVETRQLNEDSRLSEEQYRNRIITEEYDKLVFCVPADEAERLLGDQATSREKSVLGKVKYYDDITVTHSDHNYFRNRYEVTFKDGLCIPARDEDEEERIRFARGGAGCQPGYLPCSCTMTYETKPNKNELSFDCSAFQYQFQTEGEASLPLSNHIFQSRFMGESLKTLWSLDLIDSRTVLETRVVHQPSQGWKHHVRVLPYLKYLNGKRNTFYAGCWTFAVSLDII